MSYTRWPACCTVCGRRAPGGGAVVGPVAVCVACHSCPPPNGQSLPDCPRLYPYQREGAAFLARARAALLADEPGLGKTAQALIALREAGSPPAVVVVPPSVRAQWRREVLSWIPGHRVYVVWPGRQWIPPGQREVVIVGYPRLRKAGALPIREGTVVILDEAQAVKNPYAQQTQGTRRLCAQAERVWILTATPGYATASEVWEVLRSAQLHRALHPRADAWELECSPAEQEERLARVMLRRRAQDELDLPPLRWGMREVCISEDSASTLEAEAARVIARSRAEEDADEATVAAAAAALTPEEVREALQVLADEEGGAPLATLRRLLAVAKLPAALDLAHEHAEAGAPLVAFCDHRRPVEALGEEPGWGQIIGGQTPQRRDEVVRRFTSGDLRGVAVSYAAGGTGLDGLQGRASHAVLIDLPWTPAVLEQALGRLVRIGQTGAAVLATRLVADHWIDDMLQRIVSRKCAELSGVGLGLSLAEGAA